MKKIAWMLVLAVSAMSAAAQKPVWEPASGGAAVEGAIPVGYDRSGSPLYLARSIKRGAAAVGYYDPAEGRARILEAEGTVVEGNYELYTGTGVWVEASADTIPADAFSAGRGGDGAPVYLLRVSYKGRLVPAVYNGRNRSASAEIDGERLEFENFEVLVPDWVPFRPNMDFSAVFHGNLKDKDAAQHAIRTAHGRGVHPGKYNTKSGKGYIPYGGKEVPINAARTEIFRGTGVWTTPRGTNLPLGAIRGGIDDDGNPLYIIRGTDAKGNQALGKYNAAVRKAYLPWGGAEVPAVKFEILCYDLSPDRPESVVIVKQIDWVPAGSQVEGKTLFIAGVDSDGTELGVIRTRNYNPRQPGKWRLAGNTGYIAAEGREIELDPSEVELFVGNGTWEKASPSGIPRGAVEIGPDTDGGTLYVIRAKHQGADAVGKYNSKTRTALIPYGGAAIRVTSYEFLCAAPPKAAGAPAVPRAVAQSVPPRAESPQTEPREEDEPEVGVEFDYDKEGTNTIWGRGMIWPSRAEVAKLRSVRAGAVKMVPSLGTWSGKGRFDEKNEENVGFVNAFEFDGSEFTRFEVAVYSPKATPGIFILSPLGHWLQTRPLTGAGEFPAGGRNVLKNVLPETGKYLVLVMNYGEGVQGEYSISFANQGQDFPGVLSDKSPRGSDNLPFLNVPIQPQKGAFYTIELESEAFEPAGNILDSATLKPLDVFREKKRKKLVIHFNSEDGKPVLIQVKPAKPDKARGSFNVRVKFDGFGS
jgi:hypothetical protein